MAIGNFSIAFNARRADGEDVAHFFDCKAFGKTAENLTKYFQKGSKVIVEGRLAQERWESKDGNARSKVVIVANMIHFAGPKPVENPEDEDQSRSSRTTSDEPQGEVDDNIHSEDDCIPVQQGGMQEVDLPRPRGGRVRPPAGQGDRSVGELDSQRQPPAQLRLTGTPDEKEPDPERRRNKRREPDAGPAVGAIEVVVTMDAGTYREVRQTAEAQGLSMAAFIAIAAIMQSVPVDARYDSILTAKDRKSTRLNSSHRT